MEEQTETVQQQTRGEKVASIIVEAFGTWAFLISFMSGCAVWMILNGTGILHIDAFPFILLNLMLSLIAAGQGSLIMIANKKLLRGQEAADKKRDSMLEAVLKTEERIIERIDQLEGKR